MKQIVVGLLLILEKHTLSIALWLIFDILHWECFHPEMIKVGH